MEPVQRRWMRSVLIAWGATASALTGCTGEPVERDKGGTEAVDEARPDPRAPVEEARAAAQRWLDTLGPQGLVLHISERAPGKGFVGHCIPGFLPCPPYGGDSSFGYDGDGVQIAIGFTHVVFPSTPLDELRSSLAYLALDRVPPGDLRVPGWRIIPRTPVSSFREGVEIASRAYGNIQIRAKGHFFELYGEKEGQDCKPPADAPMRPECFFALEKNIPFDITIDVPMFVQRPRIWHPSGGHARG